MEETEETDDFWQEWESSSFDPTITPRHWGPATTPSPLRATSSLGETHSPVPRHQTENAKSHKELMMVLKSENKATIPDVFKKAILPSTEEPVTAAAPKKGPVEGRCFLDRMYSTDDAVLFTGLVRYDRRTGGQIIRRRIIETPVTCRYTRYHRVYKLGFYPVLGPTYFKDLPTKLGPSLVALDGM
ncbi:hypothetical protein JZ751_026868 [Albula glossodonta]|uniref:Uncharacterized protein n=1 Tax=Albula glossodonta TaxID=121402 RepID=A0A8T2PL53_9TELE|nr:hypothetical protein JZ751_026868 [Albula glossodonta]